ncbi:MAG: DUF3987 domain-containing protein [Proteobacteria bacterium]|nr:DUF3987 domain-containing protein [Pseudomonadota bacterium]
MLPEPFRSFVDVGARAIGCDPVYIVLPGLAALGAAIGTTRRIRLKVGWSEFPIVWAVSIGESGTLKSPAQDLVLEPIYQRQREMLDQGQRIICGDTTVEAVAALLEDNPRGLLLARDEFNGWIGSFDRYARGDGDVSHWLEAHGGRPMVVDRKTGDQRTIYVPCAAVSVTGPIQPRTLARAVGRQHFENGLVARMLLAMPPRGRKRWTDEEIPAETKAAFAAVIDKLLGLEPANDVNGKPTPIDVPLSPKGQRAWVAFYNDFGAEQEAVADGDIAAAYSKLEAYAARFALIFHFVRWAAGDEALMGRGVVDGRSVTAAVRVAKWFAYETQRIYQMLGETEKQAEQRCLAEWIQGRDGRVTVRQVQQNHRRYATAADARASLGELVAAGVGRWVQEPPGPRGGRPSHQFELVYSANVYETPTGSADTAGSVDVDGVDTLADDHGIGGDG